MIDQAKHTPTPWGMKAASVLTDGARDVAIFADFEGTKYCIAESFGRVAQDVYPNAEANAAIIIRAVNAHAALVEALKEARDFIADKFDWAVEPRGLLSVARGCRLLSSKTTSASVLRPAAWASMAFLPIHG